MSSSPDDLHDDALWRALAHAPDQAAAPDWRVRKAILREAHEAVGVSDGARPAVETKPWWRRLFGGGEGSSRMPWNAAFATLLVGVLVTLLWQREPVPGPQLDGAPALPAAPARKPAPVAPSEAPRAAEPAPLPPSSPAPEPSAAAAPAPTVPPEPQAAPAQPRRESRAAAPASEVAPPRPLAEAAPADAAGAAAPAAPPPAAPRAAVPAPTPSPPSSALAESPTADAAARFSAPSALASRGREAAEREAPKRAAAAPGVRTDATEPPTFSALSQWTRLTITERGGASRSMARADGRDLNALLGSAALSAVGPRPMAAAPEWRVTLERGREVLAVFEIARDQVRWREGDTPAGTGTPSAPALAALRAALREAVQPPPAEVPAAPAPAPIEPRN